MPTRQKLLSSLILVMFATAVAAVEQLPEETADQWFKVMLNDQKAGYIHHVSETSPEFVKSREFVKLNIGRAGAKITAAVSEATEFKWDSQASKYKLSGFNSSMEFGPAVVKVDGSLNLQGKYDILQAISGSTNKFEMEISDKVQPAELLMQEAMKDGIVPGVTVTGTAFSPGDMSEVDYKVVIGDKTNLPGYDESLYKCTTILTLKGTAIETVSYIDEDGNDVISSIEMMGLKFQFIVAEMEEALANEGVAEILADVSIKAPADSPDPTRAKAMRYHLKFAKADVDFYQDDHQVIAKQLNDECTIEVRPYQPPVSQQLPTDIFEIDPSLAFKKSNDNTHASLHKYLQAEKCFNPNNIWLKYNDPAIRKLSLEAVGDERDAWKAAKKIEAFVHGYINNKNLSTGWASALDIAKNKSGDCTEHAVLTAGMCLSAGIPARVAIGYFYVDEFATVKNAFYGHAWTQVWINDNWYTIDATRPHQSQCPAYITSTVIDGNPLDAYKVTQSFFKIEKMEEIK